MTTAPGNASLFPPKLRTGDEIRVIAPSRSLSMIAGAIRDLATERLAGMGLRVSFGSHVEESDAFVSSSVQSRVDDLHAAFADDRVKGILTVIGGFNSNQLLPYLDYERIRRHPKILCGFSDITALAGAIHARSGLVTYSGPHWSSFGMRHGIEYTVDHFRRCLFDTAPFQIHPAPRWSDDPWFLDQEKRVFHDNAGPVVLQAGTGEGRLVGGNLCTFNLLQGTPYMPDLRDTLLFVEDDYESKPAHFDRDLQSLIHQPGFSGVRGLVIGRFQTESRMTTDLLRGIIQSKRELRGLPVVANADFGHTTPVFTYPIGGRGSLTASESSVQLAILEH